MAKGLMKEIITCFVKKFNDSAVWKRKIRLNNYDRYNIWSKHFNWYSIGMNSLTPLLQLLH